MHTKKIIYGNPIQFFPRPNNDLLKDDPTESQNIIVPTEPEHFQYGIYFDDDYDYMQHLVSSEDFNDESKDLKEIVRKKKIKCNMLPCQPGNRVAVLKEFEMNSDIPGNSVVQKMKEIAKDEVDEDVLNALDSDAELSELEDDFIKIADDVTEKPVIKGDKGIFSQFFENDYMSNEEENQNNITENNFYNFNNVRMATNDIPGGCNFQNTYLEFQNKLKLPSTENSTKCSSMSKAFLNVFEREEYRKNKKPEPIDPNDTFYKSISRYETEYDSEEIDKALDSWSYRKPIITSNALHVNDKVSKHQSKLMEVERPRKRNYDHMDGIKEFTSDDEKSELTFTDVSQFHVPRPPKETADEKRNRKKSIKDAKRVRRNEKKISKQTYKHVMSMK